MISYIKLILTICFFISFFGCNSDNVVVTPEVKNIELLFPLGGEFFSVDDTVPIIWENITSDLVKIDFSSNFGNQWTTIADSLPSNINIYYWEIPNLISSQCIIKISASSTSDSLTVPFIINVPDYKLRYLNFYPLKIGNQWIYKSTSSFNQDTFLYMTIVGDTLINQKIYFKIENEIDIYNYYTYENVDTLTGNIFRYIYNKGKVIDNLYAEVGDKIECQRYVAMPDSYLFESEEVNYFWETPANMRTYFNDGETSRVRYSLVNGIGLFASHRSILNGGINTDTLKACRINGAIYGDSTLIR